MELRNIPVLFGIEGECSISPLSAGHINSTYKVTAASGEYILQLLNRNTFRSPENVMANISAVSQAFAKSGCTDVTVPEYLMAGGRNFAEINGEVWRMYRYIETGPAAGADRLAGYSFGTFIRTVSGTELRPVIEGYHDFGWYLSRLKALASDGLNADLARLSELSEMLAGVFTQEIPKRSIHGDAKTDNVFTGERCAVIDLDTVMSGYAALDYGDMVRSLSTGGQPDISRIESATAGFAEGLGGILTECETDTLYYGILWTTGELAIRYLTDSISEEKYFRGKTEQDCRDRADELLLQLGTFERLRGEITEIINRYFR